MRIGLGIGICFPVFGRFLASLPSWASLTRSSTATYWDASGNIIDAAIDETRISYDPAHMSGGQGILIEPARTNLLTNSNGAASTYASSGATTADLSLNALGRFAGVQVATQAATWNRITKSTTLTAGQSYVWTAWVRGGTSGNGLFMIKQNTTGGTSEVQGALTALAVNSTAAGAISLISNTLMPDGITRCVVIGFTPTASESHSFGIGPFSTTNGVNIVVLANQVEAGTDATSYIPTGASVVTRAADALTTTYAAGDYDVTATAVGGAVETLTGVTLASGEWPPITTRFLKAITITAVAAAWIMSAGSWNDSAQWDDTGLWKDSA